MVGGIIGIIFILLLGFGVIFSCVYFTTKDDKEEVFVMDTEKDNNINDIKIKNKMAKLLSNLGVIITIIGFIVGIIFLIKGFIAYCVITIISSILSMIFMFAFSEIIQLLEDIKNK